MRTLAKDLRHALRLLVRSPGFTAVAVLTLGVGIGASTALFSAIEALLLRPLPYPHAERLVVPTLTYARNDQVKPEEIPTWSYPKYKTLLATQDLFDEVAAFADTDLNLTGEGAPERLAAELVSASYFPLLGIVPARGRVFGADDDRPDVAPTVIIGHQVWQRQFGADPALVGRQVRLDGRSYTVLGIAPAGFRGLTGNAEVWIPLTAATSVLNPRMLDMRWAHWFMTVARARPGIPPGELASRMAALGATVEAAHPSPSRGERWSAKIVPLADARTDAKLRTSVLVLFGAVVVVLLIGCVNVAHLLLGRSAGRRHEIAVRAALGATRGRLVRQLVTESVLLGVLGGVVGLVLALWGLELLAALRPEQVEGIGLSATELRDLDAARLSAPVLAFSVGLSLVTGILFGIAPAVRATRVDLSTTMKETGASVTARLPARGLFAATEVALALVLVVGAGLLAQSLTRLGRVRLGFRADHVLTFRVTPARGVGEANAGRLKKELARVLGAVPGVESVATDVCTPPFAQCDGTEVTKIDGRAPFPEGTAPGIGVHYVDSEYFRTLGIPLVRGRLFTAADREGAPPVILLNEAAARTLFPGEEAVGRRLHAAYGEEGMVEVVGVVGDVHYEGPHVEVKPALYASAQQHGPRSSFVFVRATVEPTSIVGAVREAVRSIDPDLPIFSVRTLEERVRDATARSRFAAVLLGGFAVVAVLLAALGVYGVMASMVAQRRREIGIRLALGARPGAVVASVVKQGAAVTAFGLAAGVGGALAASRVLAGLVYGVTVTDPITFAATAALLAAVALGACLVAARRAARVDPLEALRPE